MPYYLVNKNELYHHGIPGQKWGVRRWQNEDGTFNEAGKKRYFETTHLERMYRDSEAANLKQLKKYNKRVDKYESRGKMKKAKKYKEKGDAVIEDLKELSRKADIYYSMDREKQKEVSRKYTQYMLAAEAAYMKYAPHGPVPRDNPELAEAARKQRHQAVRIRESYRAQGRLYLERVFSSQNQKTPQQSTRAAYNEYKKQHPNSKLSQSEFEEWYLKDDKKK